MPDATGLELAAQDLQDAEPGCIVGTEFHAGRATLLASPDHVHGVVERLKDKGYGFLVSVYGVDYYPEEPRLGVIYELLDMDNVDRIAVKVRVPVDAATLPTATDLWPGADFPEREVYDMFGVTFDGHPDLRRILMPEDYDGYPQRRDFPVGGEPVLFTVNEAQNYGKFQ